MDSLFVIQGNEQGRRFALDADVATVGRDSSNRIQLRDVETSRRHAEIRLVDDGRLLVDLDSSNGVFVNGRRVRTRLLVNGDQIQVGKTVLLFASRTSDVGAREPLVDVFQETDSAERSQALHLLAPEDSRSRFERPNENGASSAWLEKARSHLNFMYHATLAASRTLDVERLLDRILELVFQWAPVDRGCIFLYDADADQLVAKSSRTRKKDGRVKVSQTILDYVFKNRKGALTSNARRDERWDGAASVLQTGVKEAICVPMQGRYGLVGVIYIDVSRRADGLDFPIYSNENQSDECDDESNDEKFAAEKTGRFDGDALAKPPYFAPVSPREIDVETTDEPLPTPLCSDSGVSSEFLEISDADDALADESLSALDMSFDVPSTSGSAIDRRSKKLTLDHLKLMVAIGRQAALAVEDTQYYLSLAQAERLAAIGQTVAVLSHHIKNILQGIRGGSYLIHNGLKEHDEILVGKGWKIVEKNQTKISDLVLDMLTFSKERTPVWSFADFGETMRDVVELMRGRAEDLEVDLIFYPDASIPSFYFDKEQIHRAIVNLIGNALEASKNYDPTEKSDAPTFSRGRVETRLHFDSETRRVSVVVDDVGPGVPLEMRDAIFRPFSSKNKSGGTGLGLAVTEKIVREHKGKILVDDSPLGGARFVVELPLVLEKQLEDNEL